MIFFFLQLVIMNFKKYKDIIFKIKIFIYIFETIYLKEVSMVYHPASLSLDVKIIIHVNEYTLYVLTII